MMGRIRKLYKKMRHIHLRFLDNGADCDLTEPLEWLYVAAEEGEPLNSQLVPELQRIAAACAAECRPDIERLIEKALQLVDGDDT
jgi:hypothetical protein